MTTTIELEDDTVERLLNVLETNRHAVEMAEAVRWTPQAAQRIDDMRKEIIEQIE